MSKIKEFKMSVPFITIFEGNENLISKTQVLEFLISINEKRKISKEESGFFSLNIKEELILAAWFLNYYTINYNIIIGQETEKDLESLMLNFYEEILYYSKESTFNDEMGQIEIGKYRVKFGKGISKRIYEIEYKLEHSNIQEMINSLKMDGKQLDFLIEDYSQIQRVLH